jgi:homoserine O-acetyltransferase
MDLFDGLDHGGSLTASFSSLQLDSAMVIGVGTDILFPLVQQQALADALAEKVADVAFVPLDSLQGHDSFLVDMDRFRPAMAAYF